MRFDRIQSALDALGTAVAVNMMLAITAAPLIVLVMFTDAFETWPLVAAAAVIAAPGVSAAFAAFRRADENTFRAFVAGYRATWRRASLLGLMIVAVAIVLVVDVRFFAEGPLAQAAMIVLTVTALLVAGTGLVALAAIADEPGVGVRDAVRRGAWFSLQRWYLTLVSLAVLVAFTVVFVNLPLLALSALASPALYLAWTNSRYTLRPVLDLGDARA